VLSRHELQKVVILLSKFITQVALVLPSKADHKLNAVGITNPGDVRASIEAVI
jgi:hypothetical protein